MLNREEPIWYADEHSRSDSAKLAHKEGLILKAADMFKDGVRSCYIGSGIVKWQARIWFDLNIADQRKGRLELDAITKSARRDLALK